MTATEPAPMLLYPRSGSTAVVSGRHGNVQLRAAGHELVLTPAEAHELAHQLDVAATQLAANDPWIRAVATSVTDASNAAAAGPGGLPRAIAVAVGLTEPAPLLGLNAARRLIGADLGISSVWDEL